MKRFARYGVVFAIVAVGLCLAGCLKFPLGNPETSSVDPALQGYWLTQGENNASLVALYPFDDHCYVAETLDFASEGGTLKLQSRRAYKAWITNVKGHAFLTLDPLSQHLTPAGTAHEFPVVRIDGKGDARQVRSIDSDFAAFEGAKSSSDVAEIITREVENPKLYSGEPTEYRRLDPVKDEETLKSMSIQP